MSRIQEIIKALNTDHTLGPDRSDFVTRAQLAEALEAVLKAMD